YQTAQFLDRVRRLMDAVFEIALFAGRLEHAAIGVVKPTVIATAQAALIDMSETKIGAAMRAARPEHRRRPGWEAIEHQVLAEKTHEGRLVAQMRRDPDRPPIAAQQFAHRGAAHRLGQA